VSKPLLQLVNPLDLSSLLVCVWLLHQSHQVESPNRRFRNDHLRESMQYSLHPGRSSASMLSSDPGQTCETEPYLATSNSSCIFIVRQPSLFLRFLLPLHLMSPFVGEPFFQPWRTREELRPIRHQSDACSHSHSNLPLHLLQVEPLERCYYSPWLQSNPSA
jgi:hypothetical protein